MSISGPRPSQKLSPRLNVLTISGYEFPQAQSFHDFQCFQCGPSLTVHIKASNFKISGQKYMLEAPKYMLAAPKYMLSAPKYMLHIY